MIERTLGKLGDARALCVAFAIMDVHRLVPVVIPSANRLPSPIQTTFCSHFSERFVLLHVGDQIWTPPGLTASAKGISTQDDNIFRSPTEAFHNET